MIALQEWGLADIQPAMQAYAARHGIPGIATLLAHRGRIVHFSQAGWQDIANTLPLVPGTIYRIYSMTKPVVSAAFLQLCETGRLRLDDPLSRYIPAFQHSRVLRDSSAGPRYEALARPILIRDLLTHTAGLTYDFLEDNPVAPLYRQAGLMCDAGRTLKQLVTELAHLPLAFQPGVRWHYSMSIDVIAHLVEIVSGWSLEDFLVERLFKPLSMVDTQFSVPLEKQSRLAEMSGCPDVAVSTMSEIAVAKECGDYRARDVEATYPAVRLAAFARGGHGLFSTASDYFRFAQMLLNEGVFEDARVLSKQSVRLMFSNQLSRSLMPFAIGLVPHAGYGFGLGGRVRMDSAACAFSGADSEFGWEGAARTSFWVDPENELVGVLMMQHMVGRDWPEREFRELAYRALGK